MCGSTGIPILSHLHISLRNGHVGLCTSHLHCPAVVHRCCRGWSRHLFEWCLHRRHLESGKQYIEKNDKTTICCRRCPEKCQERNTLTCWFQRYFSDVQGCCLFANYVFITNLCNYTSKLACVEKHSVRCPELCLELAPPHKHRLRTVVGTAGMLQKAEVSYFVETCWDA